MVKEVRVGRGSVKMLRGGHWWGFGVKGKESLTQIKG